MGSTTPRWSVKGENARTEPSLIPLGQAITVALRREPIPVSYRGDAANPHGVFRWDRYAPLFTPEERICSVRHNKCT
jgi:hypothetical protein